MSGAWWLFPKWAQEFGPWAKIGGHRWPGGQEPTPLGQMEHVREAGIAARRCLVTRSRPMGRKKNFSRPSCTIGLRLSESALASSGPIGHVPIRLNRWPRPPRRATIQPRSDHRRSRRFVVLSIKPGPARQSGRTAPCRLSRSAIANVAAARSPSRSGVSINSRAEVPSRPSAPPRWALESLAACMQCGG